MDQHAPAREQEFFEIFRDYYSLEQNTSRKYQTDEYTLDRMLPLAELAGNPQNQLSIVHIAGTKGKGTTAHFTAALISACGKRCGTFTSPHLITVRERFQINNHNLPYDILINTARRFEHDLRRNNLKPTLFEIMTILSMRIFADQGCDFAILETGIGGTLDATNFITSPVCCAITSIKTQHPDTRFTTILGVVQGKDTAGILKAIAQLDGDLILTNPRPPKQSDLANLIQLADTMRLKTTIIDTISSPNDLPQNTPLLFTGSFFTALIGAELFQKD